MKSCGVLDLSGFMFSGKAAVSDLISEFEGVNSPNYREEFDLIRMPFGLGDVMRAFESGSLISIDHAVRAYKRLADGIAVPAKGWRKLISYGGSYEKRYPGFGSLTREFIDSLTDANWDIRWPYDMQSIPPLDVFKLKLSAKIKGEMGWPKVKFHIGSLDSFYSAAQNYLEKLLIDEDGEGILWQVTHNALEPHRPIQYFPLFKRVKVIVVERDVRDIYMTANTYSDGFNDMVEMYRRISGAHDINIFVRRQRAMRYFPKTNHSDVIYINFEDLIENYEESVDRILQFVELPKSAHAKRKVNFTPEHSEKNMRLWLKADREHLKAIRILERELPHLCRH
jgi:hypothetical protein